MMVLLTVVLDVLVAGNEGTNAEEKEVVYQYMTISDELKLTLIYVVKIKKFNDVDWNDSDDVDDFICGMCDLNDLSFCS